MVLDTHDLRTLRELQADGLRYAPLDGYWDEASLPSGFPRRHWRKLAISIGRMGQRQFDRQWRTGRQLIQDDASLSTDRGDTSSQDGSSAMDPIPLVIAENEWAGIESAAIQRVTLLNAILRDLYGEQRLLRERLLPPALLFANPQFLRPCHGIIPSDGIHLHTCAIDLARGPNGQWLAVSHRTQTPSGMGYTLETRLVSARTWSNVFSQCRVRQLARFFEVRRDALMEQASRRGGTACIVLLTPGPNSKGYFEHSFLAGHWGFPLVEGADLDMRDNRIFLKTLAGLEPVDLILRRVEDSFCDPLELRGDSLLGVPGLVQAIRSGGVEVDNALGSGLAQTPAFGPLLPQLCRHLLGEELHLASTPSWWCGHGDSRRFVLERLDHFAIIPASRGLGDAAEFPAMMDSAAREMLVRRIETRPEQYVAQEQVSLSTAPVRTENGMVARHIVLRVFVAWDGSSYIVMPGGLTRVSPEPTALAALAKPNVGTKDTKDTWVLGGSEIAPTPRPPQISLDPNAGKGGLPSRVADNLFWLGRYTERVEANVRLMRAIAPALSGEEDFGRSASLEHAISLLAGLHYLPSQLVATSIGEQRWQLQRLLDQTVYDRLGSSSLGWNLKQMNRVALQVKERLSADTWRVLRQIEAEFTRTAPFDADQRYTAQMNVLDSAVTALSAFFGLLMENTTRGYGWRFLEMGRRIERALQMAEMLSSGFGGAPLEVEPSLQLLLQIADSSITYRSRYLAVLRTDLVLQLLLVDESNPRSVGFQLATLLHQIERVQEQDPPGPQAVKELASKVLGTVRQAELPELSQREGDGQSPVLDGVLNQLKADLHEISDALTAQYLVHLKVSRLSSFS